MRGPVVRRIVIGLCTVLAVSLAFALLARPTQPDSDLAPSQVSLQSPQTFTQSGTGGGTGTTHTWVRQTADPPTDFVQVTVTGASACTASYCGAGAQVSAIIPVTGNLQIRVGKRANGTDGGWGVASGGDGGSVDTFHNSSIGGGGASGILALDGTRLIVAGGGGGGGGSDSGKSRNKGGDAGAPDGSRGIALTKTSTTGQGGGGGLSATASGSGGGGDAANACYNDGQSGSTSTSVGTGGRGGNHGGNGCNGGGGGGGGWRGGGGGGDGDDRGGGGGGGASGIAATANAVVTSISYSLVSNSVSASVVITPVSAPTATTNAATAITETSASLNGVINAAGLSTAAAFDYGTDASLTTVTGSIAATPSPLSSSVDTAVSASFVAAQPGTQYYFRASASGALGTVNRQILSFTTLPPAPNLGAFAHGDESLTINWTPQADGGATVTGWSVQVQPCADAAVASCTEAWADITSSEPITAASRTATATSLENSAYYRMRVAAQNVSGLGAFRVTAVTNFPSRLPDAVTAAATDISGTSAVLHASVSSGGDAATVNFRYSSTDPTAITGTTVLADQSPLARTATEPDDVSATLTGLSASTRYYYRAVVENRDGSVESTPVMSFDTFGLPGTPVITGAQEVPGGVQLTWIQGAANGSAITEQLVQQCTLSSLLSCNASGGAAWVPITPLTPLNAGSTSVLAAGVNGTRYWFRIAEVNAEGTGQFAVTTRSLMPDSDAVGDKFRQGGNAPTASMAPQSIVINPLAAGATEARTLSVSVTDLDGVAGISTVSLCLYFDDASAPAADGHCADADLDPANQVMLLWSEDANEFSVRANPLSISSNWSIDADGAGSNSGLAGATNTLDMDFSFHASEVMREAAAGTWKVALVVVDDDGQSYTQLPVAGVEIAVTYYAGVVVSRASQNFGTIENRSAAQANNVSPGRLVANGPTDVTYLLAENFHPIGELSELTNVEGASAESLTAGQFSYGCSNSPVFLAGSAASIPTAGSGPAAIVAQNVLVNGTAEQGNNSLRHSCELRYGGSVGLPAGTTFTAEVVVAPQAHS